MAIKAVATGPSKHTEWLKNERLILEANQEYWRGVPKIRKVTVRPIPEDSARIICPAGRRS